MVAGLEPARDIRAHRAFPPRCMFGLSIYQLIYTITTAPVYYLLPQIATLGLLGQCHKLRHVTSGRMCDGARRPGAQDPTHCCA